MQLIKMNYKGFSFPINPASIKAEYTKNISKKNILFSHNKTQEIAFDSTVVSASGSFVGADAKQFAYELTRIYKSSGEAYLFAPGIEPVKAYFKNLTISFDSKRNCVDYSVVFIECCSGKKAHYDFGYTYVMKDENLYDVADRTRTPIEKIVKNNNVADLFAVNEGEKIWLN